MIIGIGCDIVDHITIEKLEWHLNLEILKKYFSQNEMDLYYININTKFISGRFAVKEAVVKCLGTAIVDEIRLDNIEVLQNEDGKPYIKLSGEVEKISNELSIDIWHVSITHSTTQSTAFVVAESRKA